MTYKEKKEQKPFYYRLLRDTILRAEKYSHVVLHTILQQECFAHVTLFGLFVTQDSGLTIMRKSKLGVDNRCVDLR